MEDNKQDQDLRLQIFSIITSAPGLRSQDLVQDCDRVFNWVKNGKEA